MAAVFKPLFRMPARGRRETAMPTTLSGPCNAAFSTPVPRVQDLDELNRYFRAALPSRAVRTVQSLFGSFVIGTRFAEESGIVASRSQRPI